MESATKKRYHEVDALRVIAIGLLVFYHILVSYQPFAGMLMFIQNDELLTNVWFVGEIMNIWRIPILFLISGMGVRYAMERRTTRELLEDRASRILIPLFFGSLFIVPAFPYLFQAYNNLPASYFPNPGHLWFLQYLMLYFLWLLPMFVYLRKHPDGIVMRACRRLSNPLGLLVLLPIPLMLEVWIIDPEFVSGFALTYYHRFWYGFVCFFFGFLCASLKETFWNAAGKACHAALPIAISLYLVRIGVLEGSVAGMFSGKVFTAFESMSWMLAFLGYGTLFLAAPSKGFGYLNQAVFPVYIIHLPMQQLIACFLFPTALAPMIKLVLHLVMNLALCLLAYEFLIRRIRWLHPVLGLGVPTFPTRTKAAAAGPVADVAPPRKSRLVRFSVYFLVPALVLIYGLTVVPKEIRRMQDVFVEKDYLEVDYRHLTTDPTLDVRLKKAAESGDIEAMKRALAEGANVNGQNEQGHSALGSAAWVGQVEAVRLLIDAGADVNLKDKQKYRPLHGAMFLGRFEIARLLIENGASLQVRGAQFETPLDSMKAPYPIVEMMASATGLQIRKESVLSGREKIREYLENR